MVVGSSVERVERERVDRVDRVANNHLIVDSR